MTLILIRYCHFIGIFILFAMLLAEHLLVKKSMTPSEIRRLAALDLIYGLAAGVVLVAGLCLWLFVGKPAEFYSANPVFHAKLGLFVLVALLSAYPTYFFLRQRKATGTEVIVPKAIIHVIRLELVLLLIIPLLATTMAAGRGSS